MAGWRNTLLRRPVAAIALLAGLVGLTGGAVGLALASQTGHPAMVVARPTFGPVPVGKQDPDPGPTVGTSVPVPVHLVIPAIGVSTRLIRLGLTSAGTLQVPTTTAVAGWFTGGPRPGEIGPAVIAGHIDSYLGPGIFYHLHMLRPGNRIFVRHRGGALSVFRVTSVRQYLKARFPTSEVYGPTYDAALRLITCGGTFDPDTGHYLSNVIVFAVLENPGKAQPATGS